MVFLGVSRTRRKLLVLIKKSGGVSIEELSSRLKITPMGVRQHLIWLEKNGVIMRVKHRHGIGRPKFLYSLTEKAASAFPHSYNKLASDILRFLRDSDGKMTIDALFKMRKESHFTEKDGLLPNRRRLKARVEAMADMLNTEGYLAETEETDKSFRIKKFHCPISEVAQEFGHPCKYELELYRDIFHKGVLRERCRTEGDPFCAYIIPKVTAVRLR